MSFIHANNLMVQRSGLMKLLFVFGGNMTERDRYIIYPIDFQNQFIFKHMGVWFVESNTYRDAVKWGRVFFYR